MKHVFTDKQLAEQRMEWYNRGVRQARKELRQELAKVLGLDELFEPIKPYYD